MNSITCETIMGKGDGWINMANLGKPLRNAGINCEEYGYKKLLPLMESMPEHYEIYSDLSKPVKVVYVKIIGERINHKEEINLDKKQDSIEMRINGKGNSDIRNSKYLPLESWAYLRDINIFLEKLANMSQKECWSFSNGLPSYPKYPILFSYIRYTFCRLQHQGKIVKSIDGELAAFNTGLTDNRYEPIIALFKKNKPGSISEWVFFDFVISGEDKGKIIINKFSDEILSATYTDNPAELIYDVNLGFPIVDMDHVVIERIDRLPYNFLKENEPEGFKVLKTEEMNKYDRYEYYNNLREAVKNDHSAYRNMINRVKDAINLTIKRVHWNYKNAVPMFYPKENRMCLLLPLCLVDDSKEDIALVVKRTPANKYEGATILPLDWAYSDARVVARPNSEWLDANLIPGNGETLI